MELKIQFDQACLRHHHGQIEFSIPNPIWFKFWFNSIWSWSLIKLRFIKDIWFKTILRIHRCILYNIVSIDILSKVSWLFCQSPELPKYGVYKFWISICIASGGHQIAISYSRQRGFETKVKALEFSNIATPHRWRGQPNYDPWVMWCTTLELPGSYLQNGRIKLLWIPDVQLIVLP